MSDIERWNDMYTYIDPVSAADIAILRRAYRKSELGLYYRDRHYVTERYRGRLGLYDRTTKLHLNREFAEFLQIPGISVLNKMVNVKYILDKYLFVNAQVTEFDDFKMRLEVLQENCPEFATVLNKTILADRKPKMLRNSKYCDVIIQCV